MQNAAFTRRSFSSAEALAKTKRTGAGTRTQSAVRGFGESIKEIIVLRTKMLLVMRLTIFLLTAFLNVSAKGLSQNVSFSGRNVSLEKVFVAVKKQTGYVFFYADPILNDAKLVTIKADNLLLEAFLAQVLKDQPLEFTVRSKTIIISRKKLPELPVAPEPVPEIILEEISGSVLSSDGSPLSGASVKIKGKDVGVTTDANGRFSLEANIGDVLIVSHVGFQPMEIKITSKSVQVSLILNYNKLDETVVIGYGSTTKRLNTSSISSVKGSDLTLLPVQRVDQALQGRASGVYVLNNDGSPGGNTTIRVRGINSITGGNNALVVIDGLQGGNLNTLNPNDISSIEILKDASATAMYGSQGANGVILITTRIGKKGKPVIDYSYNYGMQHLRKKVDVMNAADNARVLNAYTASLNGSGISPEPIYSDAEIQAFEKSGGTDWQSIIYRPAAIQNHQLSVSGGGDNVKYLVSGGYLDQPGILLIRHSKGFPYAQILKPALPSGQRLD